jgi:peptidoglycan/LPS O-acetylase OafA/YrhL
MNDLNPIRQERIFGLDILRTFAILIVVTVHSSFILAPSFPGFPWLPLPDGVDLFFVLSGFLVGGMLIDTIRLKNGLDFNQLREFIRRRWFRTLPNYFLFLLVNILLIATGLIGGELNKYLLTYFVFFQNFYVPFDFLFWESWSLSVEEWFYLTFPLLCFVLLRASARFSSRSLVLVIVFFIVAPLLYRMATADKWTDEDHWDLFFRKLVLTRQDSIGFGILAAYLKRTCPALWLKVRVPGLILGLAALSWLCRIQIVPVGFFLKTYYLSLMPLAIALLLPFLDGLMKERVPGHPFEFISRISYSMYFCNGLVFQLFARNFNPVSASGRVFSFFCCWGLIIFLSWLNFRYVEVPLTRLRDRHPVLK